MELNKTMVIWLGSTLYESDELAALLKADVRLLTMAIGKFEVEREAKLSALAMVRVIAQQQTCLVRAHQTARYRYSMRHTGSDAGTQWQR
jgi:hypothetical protein